MKPPTDRPAALVLLLSAMVLLQQGCAEQRVDATEPDAERLATPMTEDSGNAAKPGTVIPRDKQPERVQQSAKPSATAAHGHVPDELIDAVVTDFTGKTGAARDEVEILRAMPVTWNNGSLGCPKAGFSYTQAIVSGYWIVLGHDGEYFPYHASRSNYFFLCERPLNALPALPPGARSNAADL